MLSMATQAAEIPVPALLVVDMQVDFISGSLAVPDGQSLLEPINEIIDLPFKCRYASKDFHPPGHVSFASTHGKRPFEKITIYPPRTLLEQTAGDVSAINELGLEQVLWPDHCVQGTSGAEFIPGLHADMLDETIYKGMDSGVECYSAFKEPWSLRSTNLERLLRDNGVTDLYIVGVAGDYCVKASAIDAANLKAFNTWVVTDGIRSVSSEGKEWEAMRSAGVGIIDTASLKMRLQGK
ncbi:Isochorismatase-like protein [Phlebopus sp. FC_14]|nr:Isochorismatase-like protein [Phlebopus sp. FC_14]